MLIKSNNLLATQDHAAAVRDLVNQTKKSTNTNYCVRVTADGEIGEQFFKGSRREVYSTIHTSQSFQPV
jgi:type I restriction enzyme R subunit